MMPPRFGAPENIRISCVRRVPRVYTLGFMMPPHFGGSGKRLRGGRKACKLAELAIFGVSCNLWARRRWIATTRCDRANRSGTTNRCDRPFEGPPAAREIHTLDLGPSCVGKRDERTQVCLEIGANEPKS